MNEVLTKEVHIGSQDVNKQGFLKIARLFELLQSAAFAHIKEMGLYKIPTTGNELLWVLASQNVSIERMPKEDEDIVISTWPGKTKMYFFPRQYRVETTTGELLIRAAAMWALIDSDKRDIIDPSDYAIICVAHITDQDLKVSGGPKPIAYNSEATKIVPSSYIDHNGHMNNARYFDIAEEFITNTSEPKKINARYGSEAFEGTELTISKGDDESSCYMSFDSSQNSGATNHFRLRIDY